MKKLILLTSICFFTVLTSQAQEKTWAVKINPLSLAVATFNGQFEKTISETSSVQLGVAHSGYKITGVKYTFNQITPEYRKYLGGEALNGWYAAPYLRARFGKITSDDITIDGSSLGTDSKTTYSTIGGGVVLGYEKATEGGFVFDFFVGPNYGKTSYKSSDNIDYSSRGTGDGFGLRFGIGIGFAK